MCVSMGYCFKDEQHRLCKHLANTFLSANILANEWKKMFYDKSNSDVCCYQYVCPLHV